MERSIFKAYDVRGRYPQEINEAILRRIVAAIAHSLLARRAQKKKPCMIVGRDARLSSPALYAATLQELKSRARHIRLIPVGRVTTPMNVFLMHYFSADRAIMITASHNPKDYNGVKVYGPGAMAIGGTEIYRLVTRYRKDS